MELHRIGIDLSKTSFQLVGLDQSGEVVVTLHLLCHVGSMFRSPAVLELEHLALRHQIGVLRCSARKRAKLTPADHLFWVFLSRVWYDWCAALAIVNPEKLIAWHRQGFRLFWTWKIRHGQVGRAAVSRSPRSDPQDESRKHAVRVLGLVPINALGSVDSHERTVGYREEWSRHIRCSGRKTPLGKWAGLRRAPRYRAESYGPRFVGASDWFSLFLFRLNLYYSGGHKWPRKHDLTAPARTSFISHKKFLLSAVWWLQNAASAGPLD